MIWLSNICIFFSGAFVGLVAGIVLIALLDISRSTPQEELMNAVNAELERWRKGED